MNKILDSEAEWANSAISDVEALLNLETTSDTLLESRKSALWKLIGPERIQPDSFKKEVIAAQPNTKELFSDILWNSKHICSHLSKLHEVSFEISGENTQKILNDEEVIMTKDQGSIIAADKCKLELTKNEDDEIEKAVFKITLREILSSNYDYAVMMTLNIGTSDKPENQLYSKFEIKNEVTELTMELPKTLLSTLKSTLTPTTSLHLTTSIHQSTIAPLLTSKKASLSHSLTACLQPPPSDPSPYLPQPLLAELAEATGPEEDTVVSETAGRKRTAKKRVVKARRKAIKR